jgi:redox-sensitive bicupin YhaK (pirin superfamily)
MKAVIHRAGTRGHAHHGWLDSHHTFSFASYMDPERMHFGALRVLNDDIIAGGTGFGTHPHANMEIVTIPLEGALEHKDSTGRHKIIYSGDVQIMSAGKGIYHSEYNHHASERSGLLQLWIFPREKDIEPRYDQKAFLKEGRHNMWQTVVAPDNEEALQINQDAWLSLADIEDGKTLSYTLKGKNSGAYVFVIDGKISVGEHVLDSRDGAGFEQAPELSFTAEADSRLLLIEVPMAF